MNGTQWGNFKLAMQAGEYASQTDSQQAAAIETQKTVVVSCKLTKADLLEQVGADAAATLLSALGASENSAATLIVDVLNIGGAVDFGEAENRELFASLCDANKITTAQKNTLLGLSEKQKSDREILGISHAVTESHCSMARAEIGA